MVSDIVQLYFLGLVFIIISDVVGLGLFRFRLRSVFFSVFLGYLVIIASYAIVKSNWNSVAILVLVWIIAYFFIIHKKEETLIIRKQEFFSRFVVIVFLWSIIFILKASCFWNSDYNSPNLLFIDYEFYMKIAEGYNLTGNENAMGLRNILFPYLNFAQPYRSNDFWLVSLGLDTTKYNTIYIWELFYSPILLFISSLSIYEIARSKFNRNWSLLLSVLLLFAFSGNWYRDVINLLYSHNSGSYDPIGIIAYTKLAIVFSIIFHFFLKYEKGKKIEAVYLLILIPILVQSAIAFFVFIPLIILFSLIQDKKLQAINFKKYLPLIVVFIFLAGGIYLFYSLNQQKEQLYIGYSNSNILNNEKFIDLIIQFFKKSTLMFISYFWLSFLVASFLLFITKSLSKVLRQDLFVLMIFCYFTSTLVYAIYNKVGNAYQFLNNVFGPFVLALILYLFLQTPISSVKGKIKIFLIVLISLLGMKQILGGNNVFHSTTRINYYDQEFIAQIKPILARLDYPFGIIYYGENLQNCYIEDFPQYDATFLKLFGRNYDVFNIEADSLKIDSNDESLQKLNVSISRNALNIWIRNSKRLPKSENISNREAFYNSYPFSFCISKKPKDSLPDFIKSDVTFVIQDATSKVYFYALERK
jgi:hypothetical protein